MDGKIKISFGIKTSKQKTLGKPVPTTHTDVEYISSFDANCKPLGSEKPKEELVIPIKGSKTVQDLVEDSKREKQSKSEEKSSTVTGKITDSLEQLAVKEIIEGLEEYTIPF
ncbi:hypothetical protein J437_LFUL003880 [Ladona fulva]|uniref:Uncharacterized protein n=1 Tax=Ladona fulva TaxID=123851 RepID=A0A8K0K4W2_LADFU|nr:hypothetical protein J437_LFUL003880 [Ladona fulva]